MNNQAYKYWSGISIEALNTATEVADQHRGEALPPSFWRMEALYWIAAARESQIQGSPLRADRYLRTAAMCYEVASQCEAISREFT